MTVDKAKKQLTKNISQEEVGASGSVDLLCLGGKPMDTADVRMLIKAAKIVGAEEERERGVGILKESGRQGFKDGISYMLNREDGNDEEATKLFAKYPPKPVIVTRGSGGKNL